MGTCLALQQLPFHYRSLLEVAGRRSFSSPSPTAAGSGLRPLTCARGTLEMSSVPHVEETQGTRSPGLPLMHVGEVQPLLSEGTSFMRVWGHRAEVSMGLGLFLCAVAPHVALPMSGPEPCCNVALCRACWDWLLALAVAPCCWVQARPSAEHWEPALLSDTLGSSSGSASLL